MRSGPAAAPPARPRSPLRPSRSTTRSTATRPSVHPVPAARRRTNSTTCSQASAAMPTMRSRAPARPGRPVAVVAVVVAVARVARSPRAPSARPRSPATVRSVAATSPFPLHRARRRRVRRPPPTISPRSSRPRLERVPAPRRASPFRPLPPPRHLRHCSMRGQPRRRHPRRRSTCDPRRPCRRLTSPISNSAPRPAPTSPRPPPTRVPRTESTPTAGQRGAPPTRLSLEGLPARARVRHPPHALARQRPPRAVHRSVAHGRPRGSRASSR